MEAKDCTEEEVKVKELFTGVLVFDSREMFRLQLELSTNNAQHEYYLTELPEMMAKLGMKVEAYFDDTATTSAGSIRWRISRGVRRSCGREAWGGTYLVK